MGCKETLKSKIVNISDSKHTKLNIYFTLLRFLVDNTKRETPAEPDVLLI